MADVVVAIPGENVKNLPRDPSSAVGQSSLAFRDLSFSIKQADGSHKPILEPVSGRALASTLTRRHIKIQVTRGIHHHSHNSTTGRLSQPVPILEYS